MILFDYYFSDGLKPPTRWGYTSEEIGMFLALTKIYQDTKTETEAGNVDREKTAPV